MNTLLPKSSTPTISFILPAYKGRWIKQAIESVLAQTYQNIELVIINDQSPDNLDEIIGAYTDKRIRYYTNPQNIGGKSLVKQWENCIRYANGDYLAIAADDDIYHPRFAEECIKLAERYPKVDIIRARTEQIDENGVLLGVDNSFPEYISQLEYIFRYRDGSAFICMGNFLFKTTTLQQKGFVDFPMALGSDIATSIVMAENGMCNTHDVLFSFRQSTMHISGSKTHLKPKMDAITRFFHWMMAFDYPEPKNKYEVFYLSKLTNHDWHEKCVYDYYNQVIKYVPIKKIGYICSAKQATVKEKAAMLLRYVKDLF